MSESLAYDVDALLGSAIRHGVVGEAAAALAGSVARLMVDAGAVGGVPAAGEFLRMAASVREGQAHAAAGEARRRREVAERLRSVAVQGEQLTADTARVAGSVGAPSGRPGG